MHCDIRVHQLQLPQLHVKSKLTFNETWEVSIRISNNAPSSSRTLFTVRVKDLLYEDKAIRLNRLWSLT
jgi:hypothetical protein